MNYEVLLCSALRKAQNGFLAEYLLRELRKAEAAHYSSAEFLTGCTQVIEYWQQQINKSFEVSQRNLFERENKIHLANGTPEQKQRALAQLDIERKATTIETTAILVVDQKKIIDSIKIADVLALSTALIECSRIAETTQPAPHIEAPANPYPEVFKPGGYDLFIYLYDEDTTFKPKTRVSVLYHGLRNDIFTSTVTHELFKEFLEKEFRLTTSKITKPNYRGQDYIKDTLPQMVERYKKLHQ